MKSVLLALAALAVVPSNAQFAPSAVNVTVGDAFLNVDWAITAVGGDSTIRSFTVQAIPQETPLGDYTALSTVFNFDETALDTINWQFLADRCNMQRTLYTSSPCFSTITPPTPWNTFVVSGGVMQMQMTRMWGFASASGVISSGTGYLRNGMPYMGRANGRMNRDGIYTARVGFATYPSCVAPGPGNVHSGMTVYDYDANNVMRPLIQYYYHHNCFLNTANYIYLRVLNFLGTSYSNFLLVSNVGSGFLELGIWRDHANQKWRFFYYIPVNALSRWTYVASRDVHDTALPADLNLANATVGMFGSNEHLTLARTPVVDRFVEGFGTAIDAFLQNVTNMAGRTVSTGLCQDARTITHTGLYYTTSRGRYTYRMYGLVNGLQYQVRVMSVAANPLVFTTTIVPGTFAPTIPFPTLLNSPGSSPSLFLDSASLPPGPVRLWRDSSGNGRHMVQYIPALQPNSLGLSYANPAGAVSFSGGFQELLQLNRTDDTSDLSTSPSGLSFFTSYKLGYQFQYLYTFSVISRQRYLYMSTSVTNSYFGVNGRPQDDNAGWDIMANLAGYNTAGTDFNGPGMRVTASKNPGSTTSIPNINTLGIQFRTATGAYTGVSSPDFVDPALYTYNYYPVPASSYAVGVTTPVYYTAGKWMLDGCRGVNLGKNYDSCWTPLLTPLTTTSVQQLASSPPFWGPGLKQPQNMYYFQTGWPNPPNNYDVFSTDTNVGARQNIHERSPGLLRIGDAFQYGTSTYARRSMFGPIYGILLYKNAIVDRGDREIVQRWMADRYGLSCPIPAFPNMALFGSSLECKPNGIVPSSTICTPTCTGTGVSRIGGVSLSETYSCQPNRGIMLGKGLWCGNTCPVLSMPANALLCSNQYITERFNYPSSTRLRDLVQYDVLPVLTTARYEYIWSFPGDGTLSGSLPYRNDVDCNTVLTLDSLFMVNRPTWGASSVQAGTVTYRLDVTLGDNTGAAGIAFRVASSSSTVTAYYRMYLVAGRLGGAFLEHVTYTTGATSVTSLSPTLATTFTPLPGVVYTITVVTSGIAIRISVNGQPFFDTSNGNIPHGAIGAYLSSGSAVFDNMLMEGSCQANGNCQAQLGSSCTYSCAAGYVAIGNTTRDCTSSGLNGVALRCIPPPPVSTNANPTFSVFEDSAPGFSIGFINTTVASNNTLESVVLYSIDSGNNETMRDQVGNALPGNQEYTYVFDVSFCRGEVTVQTAGAMNFNKGKRVYNLVVRARLAVDETVFTIIPVTINVLNARNPPAFLDVDGVTILKSVTRSVDENAIVGTNIGLPVSAVAVEGASQIIVYSILVGNSGEQFSINNATGQLRVAMNTLDFEGPLKAVNPTPNMFDLLIQAKDRDFPTKQATIQVTVNVIDNDDAPVVPGQIIELIEDLATVTQVTDEKGVLGPNIISTITGWADDDTLSTADTVVYGVGTNPNFYMNASTGELSIITPLALGPIVDRPYLVIDGRAVRAKITLTGIATDSKTTLRADGVTVSGPMQSNFPITVYIMVNASYGGRGIISTAQVFNAMGGRTTLDTAGGDVLQIVGEGFDNVALLTASNAVRVNLTASDPFGGAPRVTRVSGCVVINDGLISCPSSPAGYGSNLAVVVGWGAANSQLIMPSKSGSPVTISYTAPTVTALAVDPTRIGAGPATLTTFDTDGSQAVAITVKNTGPAGTPISVSFGPTGIEYSAVYRTHTPSIKDGSGTIRADLVPGIGATLYVQVIVGDQVSVLDVAQFISYGAPVVTTVRANVLSNTTSSSFETLQSGTTPQRFEILGSGFGRPTDPLQVRMSLSANMAINGVTGVLFAATFAPVCVRNANNTHRVIDCNMPSGFGQGWTIVVTVGAQTSLVSADRLGYKAPIVSAIAGAGAKNADTAGGQQVILSGTNLGPLNTRDVSQVPAMLIANPMSVTYGPTGVEYVAVGCAVAPAAADRQISCRIAPGTGKNHIWKVTVGGQSSPVPATTTSYGAPVVVSLSRSDTVYNSLSDSFSTIGGEYVYIDGANFGPALSLPLPSVPKSPTTVTYMQTLLQPVNDLNTSIGAAADGTVSYTATNCVVTIEHYQLRCTLAAGAGVSLDWSVIVDTQLSTQPLIGYRRPMITDIQMFDTTPVNRISTDGGQTMRIVGTDFGATGNCKAVSGTPWTEVGAQTCSGFVQSLTFGPLGTEFVFSEIHVVSSTEILVRSQAGFGGPFRVTITVAEQESVASTATFTYAAPYILGINPFDGPTGALKDTYSIKVQGKNFGIADPLTEVSILFGNPGDFTESRLPIPTTGATITPDVVNGGVLHEVTFFLPQGLLPGRAVRVVVHPRGQSTSPLRIVSDPLDPLSVGNSFFDYRAPNIDSVVVSASPTTGKLVTWILANVQGVQITTLGSVVQIIVLGSNFGPDVSATSDTVSRELLFQTPAGSSLSVYSWSDTRIVAYTMVPTGTLYVRQSGVLWNPLQNAVYNSNTFSYMRMSPAIDSVVGTIGNLATQGGDRLSLNVRYLDVTQTSLEVFVETLNSYDGSAVFTKAKLVDPVTFTEIVTYADIVTYILTPGRASNPTPANPDAAVFTVMFEVPAGEGSGRKVYLRRDSTDTSDTNININYAPPTVTSFQVYNEFTSTWDPSTPVSEAMIVPPLSTRIRLIGTNFGLCPRVTMGDSSLTYLVGAGASACNAPGALTIPPSEPVNTHTQLTFVSDGGQGSGHDVYPSSGYTLVLSSSGGNTAAQVIPYRFLDPILYSVTPEGRTAGGDVITITGRHFGAAAGPMSVVIGSSPCTNVAFTPVASTAVQSITCTLAEGSGSDLSVTYRSVPYVCSGSANCTTTKAGSFSYSKPYVTTLYDGGSGSASSVLGPDSLALYDYAYAGNTAAPSTSIVPTWLTLAVTDYTPYLSVLGQLNDTGIALSSFPVRLPTAGGEIITLEGDNFGVWNPTSHCLFMAWVGRDRAASFTCNNVHNFVGENQVPDFAILHWSHTRIIFVGPPGYGGREVVINVMGVLPAAPTPVHYSAPEITASLDPALGTTDGKESMTIKGLNFGTAPLSTATNTLKAQVLNYYPSTFGQYLKDAQPPQALMRVNFFKSCTSNYLNADGIPLNPFRNKKCDTAPVSVFQHTDNRIRIQTSPGIGVNRSVTVEIVDYNSTSQTYFNYTSNVVLFSYLPPTIYSVLDRPTLMETSAPMYKMALAGINLGTSPTAESSADAWTPEESFVSVTIGGFSCLGLDTVTNSYSKAPTRSDGADSSYVELQCFVPAITVGSKNVSYTVAGQSNFNSPTSMGSALFACRAGSFGKNGETCMDCPTGADCQGFNSKMIVPGTMSEQQGGTHMYPVPKPGFFDLNSTDDMYSFCPEKIKSLHTSRDVCIVGCEPPEACLKENFCSTGYKSVSPLFRCSSCDTGFYKRNNECVRCPDSPWVLVVGVVLLVCVAAGAAYVLSKKRINIGFIAIGVDWAQVIAIFAASKVAWPPIVKEIFQVLSAFNLNIEIVAPECIVPNLAYKQKWSFIMALPVALTVFFMLITLVQVSYRMFIKRRKVTLSNQGSSFMSMVLLLMYVLYIYLTRNVLDIFNCQPREPDEGKFYLTAGSGEECYKEGGTQQQLYPIAVIAAIGYIILYPAVVAFLLWSNRSLAAEDQLLRAKGVGDDKLSNPRAYVLRKRFSRIYYQFKPHQIFWILAILLRKFCLAATYILFNRNASFQLASALLVIFVAYAAQMKYAPYMGPGDFDAVLKDYQARAVSGGDPQAASLWSKLRTIEARGRKKVRRNLMNAEGKVDSRALLGVLAGWLFNYNTVEEILLFSAGVVAIMGIMYASLDSASASFADARDSVTWVIVGAIILTILYFFTVVFTEIFVLYSEQQRRSVMEKRAKLKRGGKSVDEDEKADKEAVTAAGRATINVGNVASSFNPMFEGSQSTAGLREAVAGSSALPNVQLWTLFRQGYKDMQEELKALQNQSADIRIRQQRMEEAASLIESATGRKVDLSEMDNPAMRAARNKRRMEFGPTTSEGSTSGSNNNTPSFGGASSPLAAMRRTPSQGPSSPRSLLGGSASQSMRSLKGPGVRR